MLYKFPMPSKHSGVKLYALPNQQLGIEVARPRNAPMAYDSELATGRTVTIADAEMPKAGIKRNTDMKNDDNLQYDDAATEVLSKLMDYLQDKLGPDEMNVVGQILATGDGETDGDRIGEKRAPAADRRGRRQAADQARRSPMSAAAEDVYLRLFPNANRLA